MSEYRSMVSQVLSTLKAKPEVVTYPVIDKLDEAETRLNKRIDRIERVNRRKSWVNAGRKKR